MLLLDDQGREKTHHIIAGGNREDPLLEQRINELLIRKLAFEAEQKPFAPKPLDYIRVGVADLRQLLFQAIS